MMNTISWLLVTALALAQAPPRTKAEQLQDAVRKGDVATVKALLDEGVDVNTKYRYNATPIFFACDAGQLEIVKLLLDKGADLTVKDSFYGMSPLALAVSPPRKKTPAHNEIAKLLVAKGSPDKDIALGAAVDEDDEGLAKAVLDSGGVPATALTEALEQARENKKLKTAALLEQAGAKPYDDFKIEAAELAKFAGSYHNAQGNELQVSATGARLSVHPAAAPPDQRFTLIAKDATTFRGLGMQGTTFVFTIAGDKASAFDITPVQGQPARYTRVEDK
jgi:hypothetical protein